MHLGQFQDISGQLTSNRLLQVQVTIHHQRIYKGNYDSNTLKIRF